MLSDARAPLAAGELDNPPHAAAPLVRGAALLLAGSWALVVTISVARRQEPLWPLHNISQYAAQYPSIYFFRAAGTAAGVLLSQAALALRPRARWALMLMPAGLCFAGASCVSCKEDNNVHLTFAFGAFMLFAAVEGCAAHAASRRDPRGLFCQPCAAGGPRPRPRLWAAGSAFVWASLVVVVLVGAKVVPMEKVAKGCFVSILEWAIVANFVAFLLHFARVLEKGEFA